MSRIARKVAEFLRADPRVAWVNYSGFPDSPYYALAQNISRRPGVVAADFGVKGGFEAGKTFYDALRLIKRLGQYRRYENRSPAIQRPRRTGR